MRAAWIGIAALLGCGADGDSSAAPRDGGADGATTCAPGEAASVAGGCEPAGVPASACAEGFEADGDFGCRPLLPDAPCPLGQTASLGDTACRLVAPCGDGPWGDIPRDGATVYVDAAFVGPSDGSAAKPFTAIAAALAVAAPGATIAIAQGSYVEDVDVRAPVKLWGRCPSLVSISGTGLQAFAVQVDDGANGVELHHLAIAGAASGLAIFGAQNAVVDGVWIHDTGPRGLTVSSQSAIAATFTVAHSLIERIGSSTTDPALGVEIAAARGTLDDVTVRDTQIGPLVAGIAVHDAPAPADVTIRRSVAEHNRDAAILVLGARAAIAGSVIRDTAVNPAQKQLGHGVDVEPGLSSNAPASVSIEASVIEHNEGDGVLVAGADVTIATTVVGRGVLNPIAAAAARGIDAQYSTSANRTASLAVDRSLVDGTQEVGVFVAGATLTLRSSRVRSTAPSPLDQTGGMALSLQPDENGPTDATVQASAIESSQEAGIALFGSHLVLEDTLIRDTKPVPANGIADGLIAISVSGVAATAEVRSCRIEASERAGISSFGSVVTLEATSLECNPIALDAEAYLGLGATFSDLGHNVCGCSGASESCEVLSSSLAPPALLPPH